MARLGINPARGKVIQERPAQVTVALVTYIPNQVGYFEGRLDVLKLVLASLAAHTLLPHDLMIFDNGSCAEVVAYLRSQHEAGSVDYLILSRRNIGKIDALRLLFQAAPGEIIAYSDDDILFYPGWLGASLEVLRLFPRVGMVSGVAVRDAARHASSSLERLVEEGVPGLVVSRQRCIPDAWEIDWALSTGRDPQAHLQSTADQLDLVLRMEKHESSNDVSRYCEAIGSANHFQFVTPRAVILGALPTHWTGKLMGSMLELDQAVDDLGYLRLSTAERYTRHLGNALSPEVLREARQLGLLDQDGVTPAVRTFPKTRKRHWLLRLPAGRRLLSALYRRLFDILYT
jgi:glycosyltransferase involved in cell wall biosynthesis